MTLLKIENVSLQYDGGPILKNVSAEVKDIITAAASVADHLWLMGRDYDAQGNPLPGSHIVETYDLIERDLCWHPEIITHPRFVEFVREVKDRFRSL